MSNYSNNYQFPTSADVQALATFLAQRQSDSGTTNGGIIANGNPAVPLIAQGGVNDNLGVATAYMNAIADAVMCGVGYQGQSSVTGTGGSTSSTSLVDAAGWTDYTFTAPVAKTYLVHVDVSAFCTVTAGVGSFGLHNVTTLTSYTPNAILHYSALNVIYPISYRVPVAMSAGSNTLRVTWAAPTSGTVNNNSNSFRVFTITG